MEVEEPSWSTGDIVRTLSLDPPDQPRKSIVGSFKNPRELLKLGIDVGQTSVANGMDRPCSRP
jgi:hypothetical protein